MSLKALTSFAYDRQELILCNVSHSDPAALCFFFQVISQIGVRNDELLWVFVFLGISVT